MTLTTLAALKMSINNIRLNRVETNLKGEVLMGCLMGRLKEDGEELEREEVEGWAEQ
jgi:hypothetical protein